MNELISNLSDSGLREHAFSSERPIKTLAEDELGRKDFATAVAKVISQWGGRDSLVLAIYGLIIFPKTEFVKSFTREESHATRG
jgi:predicted KAP-like P-loop ATPase